MADVSFAARFQFEPGAAYRLFLSDPGLDITLEIEWGSQYAVACDTLGLTFENREALARFACQILDLIEAEPEGEE